MIAVQVNGSIDAALRTLKKRLSKEGTLNTVKERDRGYLRPGERRRRKHALAVLRSERRDERRRELEL